jgi:hypothetical protein
MNVNKVGTQLYDIAGQVVRVKFKHYYPPHLYLVDRNIGAQTSDGKPDWKSRPDMDSYEFKTLNFDFLVPSYAKYKDPVTGEYKILSGVRGNRVFLTSPEKVTESLQDFNLNYEVWKKRNLTRQLRKQYIVGSHVTVCYVYDEAEWQRDPPKFVKKEVDGKMKRVMLSEGTTPDPIARGFSVCSVNDRYTKKIGNAKALGRAFQHYKQKWGISPIAVNAPELSSKIKELMDGKSEQEILDLLNSVGT